MTHETPQQSTVETQDTLEQLTEAVIETNRLLAEIRTILAQLVARNVEVKPDENSSPKKRAAKKPASKGTGRKRGRPPKKKVKTVTPNAEPENELVAPKQGADSNEQVSIPEWMSKEQCSSLRRDVITTLLDSFFKRPVTEFNCLPENVRRILGEQSMTIGELMTGGPRAMQEIVIRGGGSATDVSEAIEYIKRNIDLGVVISFGWRGISK